MRISDWSSDVCSSDLGDGLQRVDADPDAAINDIVRRRIGEGIFAKDVERYAASADPARRVVGRSDDVDGVDEAGQIDLVELGFVTAAAVIIGDIPIPAFSTNRQIPAQSGDDPETVELGPAGRAVGDVVDRKSVV